jgi:hypothetical protein
MRQPARRRRHYESFVDLTNFIQRNFSPHFAGVKFSLIGAESTWERVQRVQRREELPGLGRLNGRLAMNLHLFKLRTESWLLWKSPCPVRPCPEERRS